MTDLADRAIARLSEIDQAILALEYERDEIGTALRVLSSFLEPRPNATDGQAAEYAVVTPAAAERVTGEDGHTSSPPVSPEGASDEVGGVASACSASAAGSEIPERRELDVDADATGVPAGETAQPREQSDSHPAASEEPPALSKRQQVRITNEDHPDWTAIQVAEHLGLTEGSVRGHASALGIKFAPAPAGAAGPRAWSSVTKTDRVRLVHEQHPTWTARLIALELGEKESTVSTLLATVRKTAREQAELQPEFGSERDLVQHYGDVAARLGKAK